MIRHIATHKIQTENHVISILLFVRVIVQKLEICPYLIFLAASTSPHLKTVVRVSMYQVLLDWTDRAMLFQVLAEMQPSLSVFPYPQPQERLVSYAAGVWCRVLESTNRLQNRQSCQSSCTNNKFVYYCIFVLM